MGTENFLNCFVNKDTTKNYLNFQLTIRSGKIPKLKENKAYNFSLTKIGRKRKLPVQEPIETVIICAQQSFEIVGGLNPVQKEIKDDKVIN